MFAYWYWRPCSGCLLLLYLLQHAQWHVGVHTIYIYSIPIHTVILANDTDTFPILIMISVSKFGMKKRWMQQNHILLPINNIKIGRCIIRKSFSWVFINNSFFNKLNNMCWPCSFVSVCFLLTTGLKMRANVIFLYQTKDESKCYISLPNIVRQYPIR